MIGIKQTKNKMIYPVKENQVLIVILLYRFDLNMEQISVKVPIIQITHQAVNLCILSVDILEEMILVVQIVLKRLVIQTQK